MQIIKEIKEMSPNELAIYLDDDYFSEYNSAPKNSFDDRFDWWNNTMNVLESYGYCIIERP